VTATEGGRNTPTDRQQLCSYSFC